LFLKIPHNPSVKEEDESKLRSLTASTIFQRIELDSNCTKRQSDLHKNKMKIDKNSSKEMKVYTN
jgi:hypothetical protein